MHLMLLFIAVYYKYLPRNPLVFFLETGIGTKRKFRVPQKHKMQELRKTFGTKLCTG